MKLGSKVLALYTIVAAAILVMGGGLLLVRFQHDHLEDLQREMSGQLRHIDFALTSFMTEADSDVATLAANEWVRTRQDQEFTSFLTAHPETFVYHVGSVEQSIIDLFNAFRLMHPYVNSVYMGRENGSFVRSHPRAQPTPYDPRTRPWYILARDHPGQVMHTEPYPSVTTSDVNIGVVTALVDEEGRVYGVVGADITLVNLTHYLSTFEVGHGGQILLCDQNGTILVSRDETLLFQPVARLVGDQATALLSGQEGALPFATASGASQLFFYTSPRLGWKIAVAVPEAEIQREIQHTVWPELAGLLLILMLLSGVPLVSLTLAVLRPLTRLHHVTRDIARTGELRQQVEIQSRDEIGSLAASFNQMILNIRQAQESLRQERDLAEALKDAATALTTTLDSEIVLDRILEQVSRVVPNEACNFMLIEEDRVRPVRWWGYERFGVGESIARAEFSLSHTPTFRQMAASKEPLLVADVAAHPDWQPTPETAWLRSYAATPLIVRDRVVGFLSVDSSRPNFFQTQHLELLRAFADHAAAAIENARLYEQTKRHLSELDAVHRAGQRLQHLHAPDQLAQEIIQVLEQVVGYDYGAVLLIEESTHRLIPFALSDQGRGTEFVAADREYVTRHAPRLGEGITGWVAQTGQSVCLGDVSQDPRYHALRENIRSELCVPLRVGDAVIGVVNVETTRPHAYTEADQRVLETVAAQIGIAIQNARLLEQVQRHAAELERRVAERTAELEIARDRAESADRLKSAFLASMSHELRTPLNSIIGFTGILLQGLVGPLNDEQQKQLGMVMNSARHLLALINDVLDISKIEAGQLETVSEPLDMRELVAKVARTLRPAAEKKGLALVAEVSPTVGLITSDQRRVEQILINLVNNAIKFTEQGAVRVECETRGDWLVTRVMDTGIGIRPEDLSQLFQPFRQLDTGVARRHEGTGLGLSICKRLVELLGGQIEVESTWGVGSTFTFTLPIDRRRDETPDSRHRG